MNRSKVYAQILLPTSSAAEYPLATVGMRQEEQWNYFNWLPVCLKRQSPSPACVSYRGPLAKADNYYYKTEGSWINAKQSQRKSRISNRLNERITERKLKEILWTQNTDKKKKRKSELKHCSQVPSRLKAEQKHPGFPGTLNHPFKQQGDWATELEAGIATLGMHKLLNPEQHGLKGIFLL